MNPEKTTVRVKKKAPSARRKKTSASRPSKKAAVSRNRSREILKTRSRMLAEIHEATTAIREPLEVVTFQLAFERYAIASRYVSEIVSLRDLTPLPCAPDFLMGILNVRGNILPVIDIKTFFDMPRKSLTDLNKILILSGNGMEFGILADTILTTEVIDKAGLQHGISTLEGIREEFLLGIAADQLVVLDGWKLLTEPRLIVQEGIS